MVFTPREMLAIFVKVNIDDDLYYHEKQSESSSSSELDFDEFEEVLGFELDDRAGERALLLQHFIYNTAKGERRRAGPDFTAV